MRKTKIKYLKKQQKKNITVYRKRALQKRGHLLVTLDSVPEIPVITTNKSQVQGNQLIRLDSISEKQNESDSSSFKSEPIEAKVKQNLSIKSVTPSLPYVEDVVVEAKYSGFKSIYGDNLTDQGMLKTHFGKNSHIMEEEKEIVPRPNFSIQ